MEIGRNGFLNDLVIKRGIVLNVVGWKYFIDKIFFVLFNGRYIIDRWLFCINYVRI